MRYLLIAVLLLAMGGAATTAVGATGLMDPSWSVAYAVNPALSNAQDNRSLALSPDGRYMYAGYNNLYPVGLGVYKIDLATNVVVACTSVSRGKSIAVDDQGRVYLAEGNSIRIMDSDLSAVQLSLPTDKCEGVAVTREGGVLVVYNTERNLKTLNRWVLTESGGLVTNAVKSGLGGSGVLVIPGALDMRGVAVDALGRIWIADPQSRVDNGGKVFRVNTDLSIATKMGVDNPYAIALHGDKVLVTGGYCYVVSVLDRETMATDTLLTVPYASLDLNPGTGYGAGMAFMGIATVPGDSGFYISYEHGTMTNGLAEPILFASTPQPVRYKVTPAMLGNRDADLNANPFAYDPDSAAPEAKLGAPEGFGASSFYASVVNGSAGPNPELRYRALRVGLAGLFGHPVTIGDIKSMSYMTNKPAGQTIDWQYRIYTAPQGDGFDKSSWYRDRIESAPSAALNIDAPADLWNTWSTADGANQLQFGANRTGYTTRNMLWSNMASGNTGSWNFSGEEIMWVDVLMGSDTGGGTGESQLDAVRFELSNGEVATLDLSGDTVLLKPTDESIYVKPSETVVVDLNVADLTQPVGSLQAMLNFSSEFFKTGASDVSVVAGGGVWDELIWNQWNTGGDLDVAIGVKLDGPVGTQADGTAATITLKPRTEGVTKVVFRPDANPDPGLTMSTYLAAIPSLEMVWPAKLDSTSIYIDGTAPVITTNPASGTTVTTAMQSITGTVAEENSGLESVTYSVNGEAAVTVDATFSINVFLKPGNNTVTFTATDKAGNVGTKTLAYVYNQPAPVITVLASQTPNAMGSSSYEAWDANAISAVRDGLSSLGDTDYTRFEAITAPQDYAKAIVTSFKTWNGLLTADAEYGSRIHAVYKIDNGVRTNMGAAKLDLSKIHYKGTNNYVGIDDSADNGSYIFMEYQIAAYHSEFLASYPRLKGYDWNGSAWVEVTSGSLADLIIYDGGEGLEPPSGSPATQDTVNALYKSMTGAVAWPANSEVDASPVIGKRAKLSTMDFQIDYTDGAVLPSASATGTTEFTSIEANKPVIAISSLEDGLKTNVASQVIAGTVTDNATLDSGVKEAKVFLNGSQVGSTYNTSDPVSFSEAVTLVEGNNEIKVEAEDFAGNTETKTITVKLDTAAPTISIDSAIQNGTSVLGGTPHAIQGDVVISVSADDTAPSSGLLIPPTVTVTDANGAVIPLVADGMGPWTYTYSITPGSANGVATINATIVDNAGNTQTASNTIYVNKNQISGTVTLEAFVGGTRTVTFVANGGVKTWNIPVTCTGATGSFTLTDVPDGVTSLSAKAPWNLRKKVSVSLTPVVLPNQANDGFPAVGVANDAPNSSWGTGSWKANGSSYTRMYFSPMQLFGRSDVKVGDIKSITYWTKKGTTHVVSADDWFFQLYTMPNGTGWYGSRINAEPYFSASLHETAGAWNYWQSDAGDNRLRFFDSKNYNGSYTDGFLSDITSNASYKDQVIMKMGLGTSTAAQATFQGQVDGLTIQLKTGEIAKINFEAAAGPAFVLPGGDVDGSNSVNAMDYAVMKLNWFKTDAGNVADITGNNSVGNDDYNIMKLNWFKMGDAL